MIIRPERLADIPAIRPGYYPKFGFTPASRFGVTCEYEVPDNAFMLIELEEGILRGKSGMARYHRAFSSV